MGLSEELDALRVTVKSPDGRIEASMRGMSSVGFHFLYNSYSDYYRNGDPSLLAHQLARGATLMTVGYKQARRQLLAPRGFEPYSAANPPPTARHAEYLRRGAELKAKGRTPDDRVRVFSRGMLEFKVRLAADIFERLDKTQFLAAANIAMANLRKSHAEALRQLRHELRAQQAR